MHGSDDKTESPKEILWCQGGQMSSHGLGEPCHRRGDFPGNQIVHERLGLGETTTNDPD